ncbi:Ca-activated chloride channel family protein [Rhodobacter sp. JA431]|uniref:vWA domain-containing protein n=1 Tax=Rhodobacter sp. JA431 TaxID=570013 RepID=UPI000BC6469E|nr:VWA domain-containing protein [Rhodobacter sp. JA431]SOC04374.1 Ca-activated chloride channel family protein [Rhodobacter sp. JA431]
MLRFLALLLCLSPSALWAQAQPSAPDAPPATILVLDGSGSMWGQIDGVAKIEIARNVMADLVTSLPANQALGLMSYGHRRKGDCSDIELILSPGTDRGAILSSVNAITPKGKTPLTDAVIAAAEALRYTEETASVILVSDGIETCDRDPCAVGRALEAAGVGFTAHVIGFDVASDPAAQAQLRCLAEETGGLYRDAGNAAELGQALEEVVVVAEPPKAVEARLSFRAIEGPNGPVIHEGIAWTVTTEAGGTLLSGYPMAEPTLTLTETTGKATVIRMADEAVAEASFTVPFAGGPQTITLVLPEFLPPASVSGPATAPAGSRIMVDWTGPNAPQDKVMIVAVGETSDPHTDQAFTAKGSPVELRIATTPGQYELRYVMNARGKILARQPITVTAVEAALNAPDTAPAGTDLEVSWTGPNANRDYIALVPAGEDYRARVAYAYTGNGNPARFRAPPKPGAYELVYVLNDNGARELARRPITLVNVGATLSAPATAAAGEKIQVGFTAPGDNLDRIILVPADTPNVKEEDTAYPRTGSPVDLTMPLTPGAYEIHYMLGGLNGEVIAKAPITVTLPTANLVAPTAPVAAGSRFEIAFSGPAFANDRIAIVPAGAEAKAEVENTRANRSNPAKLTAPKTPGNYEVVYALGGKYGPVLARVPLTVE